MSEGLIQSNKVHRAIFIEVMRGEKDPAFIAKKTRTVRPVAERAIADLLKSGVLERDGENLKLSAEGEKVAYDLKRKDLLS